MSTFLIIVLPFIFFIFGFILGGFTFVSISEDAEHKKETSGVCKEWITPSDCYCRCSIQPVSPKETLSSETKQIILNDFMKGVE